MISAILGNPGTMQAVGETVKDVAEVFTPNATRKMELSAQAQTEALKQLGAEFQQAPDSWFDRLVNGLNRLPRPVLAFGVMALFGYAMLDPSGFSVRMVGLSAVPEPMWWLLGAIVSFYFGAREAYYFRNRTATSGPPATTGPTGDVAPPATPADQPADTGTGLETGGNAALDDWRRSQT